MISNCPFLNVSDEQLQKVKPEFRSEVKQDAEKCIEGECPTYVKGKCIRIESSVYDVEIGERGYSPHPSYLMV